MSWCPDRRRTACSTKWRKEKNVMLHYVCSAEKDLSSDLSRDLSSDLSRD